MIRKCSISSSSLYCSALQFVDSDLKYIGTTTRPRYQCLENAVMENIAIGCNVIFGETLRQLFLQAEPGKMHMHDCWFYLLASAFGNVVYDPESLLLYRTHEDTVTGLQLKSTRNLIARLKGFWGVVFNKCQLYGLSQAISFSKTYAAQLSPKQQRKFNQLNRLQEPNNFWYRIDFTVRSTMLLNDRLDNFAVRLLVLLGKY